MIDRIRERDAFVRLRREGTRVQQGPLWCAFVDDHRLSTPQVAFAFGRATGTAVKRNRLRRRLRTILATAEVPKGLLLFGGKPPVGELTFAELEARVAALLVAAQRRRANP